MNDIEKLDNKILRDLISDQAYKSNYIDCIIKLLELNQRLENKTFEILGEHKLREEQLTRMIHKQGEDIEMLKRKITEFENGTKLWITEHQKTTEEQLNVDNELKNLINEIIDDLKNLRSKVLSHINDVDSAHKV